MIKLENIKKIYNKGNANEFEALKDVSLTIKDGELVAVIGKSGAESPLYFILLPASTATRTENMSLTMSL